MMMRSSRENLVGWIGSLTFHAILLILLILISVPEILQRPDFVEMNWGSLTGTVRAASLSSPMKGAVAGPLTPESRRALEASQTIVPPERRIPDFSDEMIRVPKTEKLMSTEGSTGAQRRVQEGIAGEREISAPPRVGEKESQVPGAGLGTVPGAVSPTLGQGSVSSSIDQGVSYAIQWLGGGTRKRLSGDLPRYPEGVNVEAQIRIQASVLPDGSVKVLQPAQKGNTRLEEVAMKEVRYWRFEPLRPSQPQVDQKCEIVFLFTLK